MTRGAATIVIAAMLMSGCATTSTSGERTISPTTTPTTKSFVAGPQSRIVPNLGMTIWAQLAGGDSSSEQWRVESHSASEMEAILGAQLPLHKPYNGIPWCKQVSLENGGTAWSWGSPSNHETGLYVAIFDASLYPGWS